MKDEEIIDQILRWMEEFDKEPNERGEVVKPNEPK